MTSSSFVLHVLSSNQPTPINPTWNAPRTLQAFTFGATRRTISAFLPDRRAAMLGDFRGFFGAENWGNSVLRNLRIWLGRLCADRYYTNTYYIYTVYIICTVYIYRYQLTTLSNLIGCLVMFGGFPLLCFFLKFLDNTWLFRLKYVHDGFTLLKILLNEFWW